VDAFSKISSFDRPEVGRKAAGRCATILMIVFNYETNEKHENVKEWNIGPLLRSLRSIYPHLPQTSIKPSMIPAAVFSQVGEKTT
jgi:hypothetical protein